MNDINFTDELIVLLINKLVDSYKKKENSIQKKYKVKDFYIDHLLLPNFIGGLTWYWEKKLRNLSEESQTQMKSVFIEQQAKILNGEKVR